MRELAGRRDHRARADQQRAQHRIGAGNAVRRAADAAARAARAREGLALLAAPSSAARCWRSRIFVLDVRRSTSPTIRPGFTANVVQTAANKGVLLAFVAMAQTLVVLTAGIDLSVGMVFVLTNCLASWHRRRHAADDGARRRRRAARPASPAARSTALIVIYGRLQPIVTTIATGAIFFGLALLLRPLPGGSVNEDLADALTGRSVRRASRRAWSLLAGCRAGRLGAVPPLGHRPRRLCRRLVGGRRLHVRRADPARQVRRLHACRACSPRSAGCS